MTTETGNLVESDSWRAMEDFTFGADHNRIAQSDGLRGTEVTVTLEDGSGSLAMSFDDQGNASWSSADLPWVEAGSGPADIVQFLGGAYWVDVTPDGAKPNTLTVVFHPERRWALVTHTIVEDEDFTTETRVTQNFYPGWVGDGRPDVELPAPTRDLIGKRTLFRYSPNHLYEHIYLSSRRFAWHNLVGEQRGHAAVELATTYKLDDELYLFTWREERIPTAPVLVFDYGNGRSTGKFLGLTSKNTIQNDPAGAEIIPFGYSNYDEHQAPV